MEMHEVQWKIENVNAQLKMEYTKNILVRV